jgi:hypothetical protein
MQGQQSTRPARIVVAVWAGIPASADANGAAAERVGPGPYGARVFRRGRGSRNDPPTFVECIA